MHAILRGENGQKEKQISARLDHQMKMAIFIISFPNGL